MVEPITMIIIAANIIDLIGKSITIFQKFFSAKSSPTTTSSVPKTTQIVPVVSFRHIVEDTTKIKYGNLKEKKNYESNSGISIGFILIIAIGFAIIAFIIYRKRTEVAEDRFSFRRTEKDFESSPSPPTSQTKYNH